MRQLLVESCEKCPCRKFGDYTDRAVREAQGSCKECGQQLMRYYGVNPYVCTFADKIIEWKDECPTPPDEKIFPDFCPLEDIR